VKRAVAFIAVLVLGGSVATPGRTLIVAGYRLYPAPPRLASQCKAAQRHVSFPVLCPTLLPHARDGTVPSTFAAWADYPKAGIAPWLGVEGHYGVEGDPVYWNDNTPTWFFHFFVYEGKLDARQLNLTGVPYPQTFLGRHTIAGHRGALYDQVSYSICNECSFTGHVTFIWHEHGVTYAASLHRWSARPDPSVLSILRALIAHLEPA
jgi:hypothetical protein